jgi:hypothetical protein
MVRNQQFRRRFSLIHSDDHLSITEANVQQAIKTSRSFAEKTRAQHIKYVVEEPPELCEKQCRRNPQVEVLVR